MLGTLRAWTVLILIVLLTLPMIPLQFIANRFSLCLKYTLPLLWHRIAARLIGVQIRKTGAISQNRPLLLVSNHISWLDIVVLSTLAPMSFIAKKDVAGWPGISVLARLQRTIFVDRERRTKTGQTTDEIGERLSAGEVIVLFGEGTSTSGTGVAPFRSALIGAVGKAGQEKISVQPVALAYTHLHGIPTGLMDGAKTGYYGDMNIVPHLWSVLKKGGIDAAVSFGSPFDADQGMDRKTLTRHLETEVRALRTQMVRG